MAYRAGQSCGLRFSTRRPVRMFWHKWMRSFPRRLWLARATSLELSSLAFLRLSWFATEEVDPNVICGPCRDIGELKLRTPATPLWGTGHLSPPVTPLVLTSCDEPDWRR